MGPLRRALLAALFPVRRHGEPLPDFRHAHPLGEFQKSWEGIDSRGEGGRKPSVPWDIFRWLHSRCKEMGPDPGFCCFDYSTVNRNKMDL